VRQNQRRRLKYAEDPEYREDHLARNRTRRAENNAANERLRIRCATDEEFHQRKPVTGRAHSWRKLYGIFPQDVAAMLARQNGVCGICKNKRKKKVRRLSVDHCHETHGVRGLLCDGCNLGLGKFEDNPEFLRAAADWIEAYKKRIAEMSK
jgi:hypothetical protein